MENSLKRKPLSAASSFNNHMDAHPLNYNEKRRLLSIFLPTIRHMDYRRLRRQLQGVRKPLPFYRVIIFTLFCVFLICYNYLFTGYVDGKFILGFTISTSLGDIILTVFLATIIIISLVFIARVQSSLSLQWSMYTCYFFIIGTLIYFIIDYSSNQENNKSSALILLYTFASCQLLVYFTVKFVIYIGPKLALRGYWFSWFENFKVLEKHDNSITFCRYNDISGLCGNNIFCFCLCCYRISYRALRRCFKLSRKIFRVNLPPSSKNDPPFSHQLRYKGSTDSDGRPHGFGEWLEDHPYGERLQGFWWHGFPFGTYEAQEIGSGSLFVSSLVGFFAVQKHLDIHRGVCGSEISISGHFFNDFPNSVFVNPLLFQDESNKEFTHKTNSLFGSVIKRKVEATKSTENLSWCFAMLNWQSNNPYLSRFDESSIRIYLDRNSGLLAVNGYTHDGKQNFVSSLNINVKKPRRSNKLPIRTITSVNPQEPRINTSTNLDNLEANTPQESDMNEILTIVEEPKLPPLTQPSLSTDKISTTNLTEPSAKLTEDIPSGNTIKPPRDPSNKDSNFGSNLRRKYNTFTNKASLTRESFVGNLLKDTRKRIEEVINDHDSQTEQILSGLFEEQDEWRENQDIQIGKSSKIFVKNWKKIRSPIGSTPPDEVLLFIPGYNVNIAQGCAQLSHFVSFSKLPNYIQPFMFHWGGHMKGIFAPLMYPWCKVRAQTAPIGELFYKFLLELKEKNVRRIHLLSHSAGTRAFMNGMRHCADKGLFKQDTSPNKPIFSSEDTLVIKSIILINPDYSLKEFLEKDFFLLHKMCKSITLYGDTRDRILTFSQKWNREKCLGKGLFDLYFDNSDPQHKNSTLSPNYDPSMFLSQKSINKNTPLSGFPPRIFDPEDQMPTSKNSNFVNKFGNCDVPVGSHFLSPSNHSDLRPDAYSADEITHELTSDFTPTNLLQYNRKENLPNSKLNPPSLNYLNPNSIHTLRHIAIHPPDKNLNVDEHSSQIRNQLNSTFDRDMTLQSFIWIPQRVQRLSWLDIDVIDTTFVETHTDFLKHCFYQVSREIIDDIREVITTGNRAHERISRLDKRRGNVFCFRVAPANVKGIYK